MLSVSNEMEGQQHIATALRQYKQRLECARRTSHRYYHKHQAKVNAKRVIENIARGRTPIRASVEKYDRAAILQAWLAAVESKSELTNREKSFHVWLTGSEWMPCKCV